MTSDTKQTLKNQLSLIMSEIVKATDIIEETATDDDDKYIRIGEKLVNIWSEIYDLRQKV